MLVPKTKYQRQSARITTFIGIIVIILLFLTGMTYWVPPLEYGMEVNFGTTDYGSGDVQPLEPIKSEPQETEPEMQPEEEEKEETPEPAAEEEASKEEVITEENDELPIPKEEKQNEKVVEKPASKEPPKPEPPKEEKKEVKKPDPTPSKSTQAALESLINAKSQDGQAKGSEGDDDKAGDKGQIDGNPYANAYFGSPGRGGSGGAGYGLNGRNLLTGGKVVQECNEEGRVVVEIEVDRYGKVIRATPGVKGTTNNHPCLLKPAKETALLHRWNVDDKAPNRQIGFVVINFSLSE